MIDICASDALINGGRGVRFEVSVAGRSVPAFVVRFAGSARAYLNRCAHVAMELDWQPNRVFDDQGQWLLCASHGAAYRPDTGQCSGGPCQGGLIKIALSESEGVVYWHSAYNLKPLQF